MERMILFCTEEMGISEYQLAALLAVRPTALMVEDKVIIKKLTALVTAITLFQLRGIEGKILFNCLNETLADEDCIMGMIAGVTADDGEEKARKIIQATKKVAILYLN